jgi:hypothetical protein
MLRKITATGLMAAAIFTGAGTVGATNAAAACDSYLPGPQRVCAGDTYTPTGKGLPFGVIKGWARVR